MNENIKKSIKQAEDIVKSSKVSNQFASSAYEVVLTYLLQINGIVDKPFMSNSRLTNPQPQSVSNSSDWSSLLKDKKPANIYQLIALIVGCLESEKSNEQQDSPLVSIEEIKTVLEKEGVNLIKDKDFDQLNQRIADTASKYKYIKSKKRGLYALSPLGRKTVENLPNQSSNTREES